jgi:hypothetical protein
MNAMMLIWPPQIEYNCGGNSQMRAARANPSHDQPALVDFGAVEFSP